MTQQVLRKWGNSPAVRIPASVMEAAHLTLDQTVEVTASEGRVIIEAVATSYTLEALLAGMTEENLHQAVDFGLPQGREQL
jgi:antitoxin MazE